MMAVIAVFSYNQEISEIKRELKNGFYNPISYHVANTLIQIPSMGILAISAIAVSGYGIADLWAPSFGQLFLAYTITFWSFECIAQLMSLIKNPLLGMLNFVNFWFTSFLFAGFFAREVDVIWPFKLFVYILPMRWSLAVIIRTEFIDSTWLQAAPANNALGYACDPDVVVCFGYTGRQVLKTLAVTFPVFTPEGNYGRDVGYIIAIGCAFKLLYFAGFYLSNRAGAPIKPSSRSSSYSQLTDEISRAPPRGPPVQATFEFDDISGGAGAAAPPPPALSDSSLRRDFVGTGTLIGLQS